MNTTIRIFLAGACAAAVGCKKKNLDDASPTSVTSATSAEDASTGTEPSDAGAFTLPPAPPLPKTPLGLPDVPSPDYNPTTAEKVALGSELFSDPSLSSSGEHSCSTCHTPETGWANSAPINTTASGAMNQRHTPSLAGVGYHTEYHWDGRTSPLEAHILGHWEGQLGLSAEAAATKISDSEKYQAHFTRAFGSAPEANRAAEALAAYVRTLTVGDTPWDRYEAGDTKAVSADAIAGAAIFNKRAGCATCHAPPLYTDLGYHNLQLPASDPPDVGRQAPTGHTSDFGAFKTPSLRGVLHTAPYFHNGSATSLDDVLAHKEAKGSPRLTPDERRQLIAFLTALSHSNSP